MIKKTISQITFGLTIFITGNSLQLAGSSETTNASVPAKSQHARAHPELNVVTDVKPLQELIIGYMGSFEYVEDTAKYLTEEAFWKHKVELANTLGLRAYNHLCECFCVMATEIGPHDYSRDGNWYVHLDSTRTNLIIENQTTKIIRASFDLHTITPPPNDDLRLYRACLSPSASTLLTMTREENKKTKFKIWDTNTKSLLWQTVVDDFSVANFSPDGLYIVYFEKSKKEIIICDSKTGALVASIRNIETSTVEFSHDGKYIACGNMAQKTVRFFEKKNNPLLNNESK